ncbi:Fur family transcriptional regulator [Thermoflexus sp.]|uniref:Fur family transcriptional regulator n=1 Tax=Thermoflexus sp. TaxID=1969742 RepID=UPI0025FE0E92|nr:Fur family transcriptional regulator [Thermoflexus sp.]MDW8181361.1 Fur family transcriptional regulator [Anaerolineae bacterium]MCS6963615.1 transcriptional repressor [Thermoflexus sp.]MCS7351902.1 transcriptional repressor [Thermoflexus sp.]MCX7691017.1 transcriptional repressor [Thermoflexus sp.]MDW8185583.1 Fur family transcriptional regulator [Anaerolineae bacterium]
MNWEERLSRAGWRITMPRRVVMWVLQQAGHPLSPQEIHARGRRFHRSLGLVSVYRALAVLEQVGLVRRVHREDRCDGYILASPGHHHILLCRGCGRTVEFPGAEDLSGLIAHVERRTGFRVEDHLLQLVGLCPPCRGSRLRSRPSGWETTGQEK